VYFSAASELGFAIARRGWTLIYGGTEVGLMGTVARAAAEAGGKVVGVIPQGIADHGIGYRGAGELVVTPTVRERKQIMEERADAFVALPGGFGTLEEILEVLTLKQLGYHSKPIVFLDIDGYYTKLVAFFEHLYALRFARVEFRALYRVCSTSEEAIEYIQHYRRTKQPGKWFR
jgi:uncharacterized protein (TIGR00730 family)